MLKEKAFYRTVFCMDLSEERFPGYTDGDSWNGFACPYFTFSEAIRLLDEFGNRWEYVESKDAFLVWSLGATHHEYPEEYQARTIHVNGEDTKVYPIGAYSWIWDTCG